MKSTSNRKYFLKRSNVILMNLFLLPMIVCFQNCGKMTALNLEELNPENIVASTQDSLASLPTVEILPANFGGIGQGSGKNGVNIFLKEDVNNVGPMWAYLGEVRSSASSQPVRILPSGFVYYRFSKYRWAKVQANIYDAAGGRFLFYANTPSLSVVEIDFGIEGNIAQ